MSAVIEGGKTPAQVARDFGLVAETVRNWVKAAQELRGAIVVLMSAQGRPASAIKTLMQVSDDYVSKTRLPAMKIWNKAAKPLRLITCGG